MLLDASHLLICQFARRPINASFVRSIGGADVFRGAAWKNQAGLFLSGSTQGWRSRKPHLLVLGIRSVIFHPQFKKKKNPTTTLGKYRKVSSWRGAWIDGYANVLVGCLLKTYLDLWCLWFSSACCQADLDCFVFAFCLCGWLFGWLTGHAGARSWAHQHPLWIPGSFLVSSNLS